MSVVTRFAPSPTGFLHIGGARTALFNWLFSRHHGGTFRLRIEDTDRKRSTPAAVQAILDGLRWLELHWDDDVVYQSHKAARHAEVARELLRKGKAYYCYCTPEELAEMRERARVEGRSIRYDGRWRDRDPGDAPPGVDPVIRLKAPLTGATVIRDRVQGNVEIPNSQLDDMILLRSDGTPTYMHSVVVDDHDMGITHVIRGDDHLVNAARQIQLFEALDWPVPVFGHIPLIHGSDGAKLSKRHGALGVEAYRDMGYLPEAMRNYLLRLGWAHGNEEILETARAIALFDLGGVGRSPARFDFAKLESLNAHYMKLAGAEGLAEPVIARLESALRRRLNEAERNRIRSGLGSLIERAKTLVELAERAAFYVVPPTFPLADAKAAKLLEGETLDYLLLARKALEALSDWNENSVETVFRAEAERAGVGLGKLAQPVRAALTGSTASPSLFEVMGILGRDETLRRLDAVVSDSSSPAEPLPGTG